MPVARSEVGFVLAVPPAAVVDHLSRAESWVGLSPLVTAVRDVDETDGVVRYTAVEVVPLPGGLRWTNLIRVSIERSDAAVWGHVDSPGGVTLDYRYELAAIADGCRVTDAIEVRAPLGLTRFAMSRAAAVQRARGPILAARLEH
ncbi:SRPBCC family protein [Galbitalea sp. SE-J8]|uniref:SRPBCC family protein n=1 Tax=Galbitalea sp. SE-J8 TaxID=3054952 RepID=UPI00259CC9AC|nr:SRPBCC family protein [Galbitalea sp. SE-J8]MDM4763688.1 SRPBCC family protein [Galbitalea sp. SE-J8]